MKRFSVFFGILIILAPGALAQPGFPMYHDRTDFSLASPGAYRFGLYGYDNPAILSSVRQADAYFSWADEPGRWDDFNRWGLFLGAPHFGFSVNKQKVPGFSVADYQLSASAGDLGKSVGFAYGWSAGDRSYFQRSNIFKLGMLLRPGPYVSFGAAGTVATNGSAQEAALDLAGRPLGNELVTLFADYAIRNTQRLNGAAWSMGAVVEALPGVRIAGRYFDTKAFSLGLELSLGGLGVSTQSHYDSDRHHSYNTYGIRLGAADRTLFRKFEERNDYLALNLIGQMKYQRYVLFDQGNTLAGMLETIEAAKNDDRVAGIAINTSGMSIPREMLWELREKLKDFKTSGKKVIIFIDRPLINEYHFATVADKIVLDPSGMVIIQGFIWGRTYLKGTLDKIGIGYDEWRFFKYKSAEETYSRGNMSDADREQLQTFTDEFYRVAKADICEGRNFSPARFDSIANEGVLFLPADALAQGLVDTLGRWDEVEDMVEQLEGSPKKMIGPGTLDAFTRPYDNLWGERPRIALIYALGLCAMDEGIRARSLVNDVVAAGRDPRVKAVVLRIDSPGGDAMASDYIAEAVKKVRKKKPVIVSQGNVAGSGGYWLSMNADTIVAYPGTITGSIGVAGGWLYNKGLKEYLGISTDFVKAGAHADLAFGFTLPLIGTALPDRNLTPEERKKAEHAMESLYREFVSKVADGRKRSFDEIERIAQGRVWTGSDGKKNGLVDVIGGLDAALSLARSKAGIAPDQEVAIVEYPKPGLFDLRALVPRFLGVTLPAENDVVLEQLKFRLDHNGEPMPMLPLDFMDLQEGNPHE